MSHRLTPLSRNQLLELEARVRSLIAAVTDQQQQQQQHSGACTPASVGDQSWPSSAPSTPTSLSANAPPAPKPSTLQPDSANAGTSAFAGLSTSHSISAGQDGSATAHHQTHHHHHHNNHEHDPLQPRRGVVDHAVLHGTFIDVFTDPLTASAWRLYDKILYIVWWSYRPPSCANCGMQDAWMPSGDVEFKCAFCITGAGTTRSNAVVEDIVATKDEVEDGNESGEDDEVDEKDKTNAAAGGGGGGGGGGGSAGGGPLDTYLFFYQWLQRIPLLGGSSGVGPSTSQRHANGGGGGGGASAVGRAGEHHSGADQQRESMAAAQAKLARSGRPASATATAGGAAASSAVPTDALARSASGSVMLPTGEALPTVLRAAYDISSLLTAPGLPRGTAPVLHAAGLYMSLLLHRYVALFPLFCLAGRAMHDAEGGTRSAAASLSGAAESDSKKEAEAPRTEVELQWIDVELVCALLGVSAPSFFESTAVSVQHLQNVFTVAAAYGVPSVLWHPARVPGRVELLKNLQDRVIPLCPLHSTSAGVSGLSPEHTAMVVALELARRVDAHPVAASSTSPAAAAQNAQRVGVWLDSLGLYPTRRVYRDFHSFHHAVEDEERRRGKAAKAEEERGDGAAKRESGSIKKEEEGGEEEHRQRVLWEWEKSLTELAAVNDAHLIAAAERHAHRHDAAAAAASVFDLGRPSAASASSSLSLPASASSSVSSAGPLTTQRSPFYRRFEWILTSPCANALLHIFATVFRLSPMELADMALRSGIYQGHASGFVTTLRTAMMRGHFDVMPLARRLSPVTSSWMAAYMALHSSDRLPLLAALSKMNDGQNTMRDRQAALTRLLQRILRRHHAAQLYQFNFMIRVTDSDEKHFNGIYFLSSVLWQDGLAVFTCLRSGRKTITLNRFAHTLSLNYLNAKEKVVSRLSMHAVSPVVAAVETDATRSVMEVALGAIARGAATHGDPWSVVVRCLDKCARVRRRMRVPMLASRLDALASIRENVSTVVRRFQQFPSLLGPPGFGGGSGGEMGPTLLGWGETETLLAAAPLLDVQQLRRDLQWNFLSLPNASMLSGLSENRVVAMYASLVGILELVNDRLSKQQQQQHNWVEELLFVEPGEDGDDENDGAFVFDDYGPVRNSTEGVGGGRGSLGWSPPMYRNSRGGTPKQSRSPKSKFVTVTTATNISSSAAAASSAAAVAAGGSASATSAFTTSYAGGGGSRSAAATTATAFARLPYTMTPPSLGPSRSPMLRAVTGSRTPPLVFAKAPQAASGARSAQAATAGASSGGGGGGPPSKSFYSHNAVSTPVQRFRTPPQSAFALGGAVNRTPPLTMSAPAAQAAGGYATASGESAPPPLLLLPDLELSASTADVEMARTVHGGGRQQAGRRRRRERSDSDSDEDGVDDKRSGRVSHERDHTDGGDGSADAMDAQQQQQQAQVMQLLSQSLPPYWEVMLGLSSDLSLPASSVGATRRGGKPAAVNRGGGSNEDEDEDDDEEGEGGKSSSRNGKAHADRERRRQRHQRQRGIASGMAAASSSAAAAAVTRASASPPLLSSPPHTAPATAALAKTEAAVEQQPFNLFDAEECRRRLHRLYNFIALYLKRKQRFMEQVAAGGTLPVVAVVVDSAAQEKPSAAPTPSSSNGATGKAVSGAAGGSPPASLRAAAAAGPGSSHTSANNNNANGSGASNAAGRSPPRLHAHAQLTPPPPFPTAQQRSPPHRPSPTPSPRRRPQPSGVARSPTPLSPDIKASTAGGSPKQQQNNNSKSLVLSPPLSSKRASAGLGHTGGAEGGQRPSSSVAVALVDDADFALPPSEVTWAKAKARGAAADHTARSLHDDGDRRRPKPQSTLLSSPPPQPQTQQQQGVRPSPKKPRVELTRSGRSASDDETSSSSSSSTSDSAQEEAAEERKKTVAIAVASPAAVTPRRKKRRRPDGMDSDDESDDNAEDGHEGKRENKKNDSSSSSSSSSDGEAEEESVAAPPLQQTRRKAKKLGRRRRRQEQNVQYQQQNQNQQQQRHHTHIPEDKDVSPPPSRSSSRDVAAISPEVRTWRNGKVSGSVSPLSNSPALAPRPGSMENSPKQRPQGGKPGGSPTQKHAVPAIRGRATLTPEYARAPSSSSSASSRSGDYDADTN